MGKVVDTRNFIHGVKLLDEAVAVAAEVAIASGDAQLYKNYVTEVQYREKCLDDYTVIYNTVEDKVTIPSGASVHGLSALESMEILKQITVEEITNRRDGAVFAHLHLNGSTWASKVSKEEK